MGGRTGQVLVVDDNVLNRKMLARAVEQQGHRVTTAKDGRQALALLRSSEAGPFDVVLLDILMPEMDGYQVLEEVKGDAALHHIPVIMISALDEMESVIRCIETGATDYLPKPFNPALLQARLNASLAEKRLRDLELEYLEQVGRVTDAAAAVESAAFDPARLDGVAARDDALGQLARVFQRMAREVHLREQRLKQQLQQLHLDLEEMRRAFAEPTSVYVPMDRRQALARGETLPERTRGAALFADISGFSPLTAALAAELGLQRGAEELTRLLNQVYGALIDEVHRYGGSVIGFSGDAITCWLDQDPDLTGRTWGSVGKPARPEGAALRAVACGLAMQGAMAPFISVQTPTGSTFSLAIKVAVVAGPVRRFLVGDPQIQNIEALAGRTLDELALAEHCAQRGDVVVQPAIVEEAGEAVTVAGWRADEATGQRFALVSGLREAVAPWPWPELAADSLPDERCRPWLLPAVYRRMCSGTKQFLAELRPAVALFLQFGGIDYDRDAEAGVKLDAFVRWVQAIIERHDGSLIQLTIGDKGNYLYAAFGAPVAHSDDEVRAVLAALALQRPPPELQFIRGVQIGLAWGQMRTGAYGGPSQRTYGVLGDKTVLAARLMQAADGGILCEEAVFEGARARLAFEPLPPITVKGRSEAVVVYRPRGEAERASAPRAAIQALIDRLAPAEQLTLKVASVLGRSFSAASLHGVYPDDAGKPHLHEHLDTMAGLGLIIPESRGAGEAREGLANSSEPTYAFQNPLIRELAYNSLLFAQRRHLHRLAAEWYEENRDELVAQALSTHYAALANHWRKAEEPSKAIEYLERAGQQALQEGAYEEAERYLRESLALDAGSAVLSTGLYAESKADPEGARRYALARLERELPPELTYHNLFHTRDDVLPAVQRLAALEGIDPEETRLLEVAAVYHDIGFTVQRQDHERIGAEIAAEVLPRFGFSPAQIAAIQDMILATRLPQGPQTPLEAILADADLDILGREDFFARNEALRAELAASGAPVEREQWMASQLQVLENHRYFTASARSQRDAGKRRHTQALKEMLAQLKPTDTQGGGSHHVPAH